MKKPQHFTIRSGTNATYIRVPQAEIEEKTVTPLSPMPANMGDQLGDVDLPSLNETT